MTLKPAAVGVVCLALVFAGVMLSDPADAEDGDEYYCYSNVMSFFYEGDTPDADLVEWDVVGIVDGAPVELEHEVVDETHPWTITIDDVDVSGCSEVRVTQTVHKGGDSATETNTYRVVKHLEPDEQILVKFFVGESDIHSMRVITEKTVVQVGGDIVEMPADPVLDGHVFLGWFTADGEPFDSTAPVTADTDVYAHWRATGSDTPGGDDSGDDGPDQSVDVGSHIVVFEADMGLTHGIVSMESGTVVFEVSVLDGFVLDGPVTVTASAGTLTDMGDGRYMLSDIDRDILVSIGGDASYIFRGDSDDVPQATPDGGGFPWWVVVAVAAIGAAAAVIIVRGRQ